MGPTATGKTDLALALAEKHDIEIISVDSAMVYRSMDIGTAKPDQSTLQKIPHHLIDIRQPWEPYSAADFSREAAKAIEIIIDKGHTPLLVGGTMLYFKALQQGLAELPEADEHVRNDLLKEAKTKGWEALHDELKEVDPKAAQRIHPNDPQRLQRALEVYRITGQPLSALLEKQGSKKSPYNYINIALDIDRKILHKRIEQRFKKMLDEDFVEEVKKLYAHPQIHEQLPAIKSLGYQQVWLYLDGKYTYDEMVEKTVIATRQFAKRQFTWLRAWSNITWFNALDEHLVPKVESALKW